MNMKKVLLASTALVLPFVTKAESHPLVTVTTGNELGNLTSLAEALGGLINTLLPVIFALALLYFFWGLAKFVMSSGEDKESGKNIMIWGIVALFVMASVWGIVGFIQEALGVSGGAAPSTSSPFEEAA